MAAELTEKEFSKHVNTKFRAQLDAGVQAELELDEVKGYPGHPGDQQGMERFSIYFKGPTTPHLPQQRLLPTAVTYKSVHQRPHEQRSLRQKMSRCG